MWFKCVIFLFTILGGGGLLLANSPKTKNYPFVAWISKEKNSKLGEEANGGKFIVKKGAVVTFYYHVINNIKPKKLSIKITPYHDSGVDIIPNGYTFLEKRELKSQPFAVGESQVIRFKVKINFEKHQQIEIDTMDISRVNKPSLGVFVSFNDPAFIQQLKDEKHQLQQQNEQDVLLQKTTGKTRKERDKEWEKEEYKKAMQTLQKLYDSKQKKKDHH